MYIKPNRYGHVYDSIIRSARTAQSQGTSTCPVLIISSMDIDALCACKMLQYLLKQDSIKHRIIPVSGWKDLNKVSDQLKSSSDQDDSNGGGTSSSSSSNNGYKEVVLLNLGGQVDLWDFFEPRPGINLHVIDSHRPCSLENLFQSSSDWANSRDRDDEDDERLLPPEVIVWDDGHVDDDLQAEKDAFQALKYIPDSDSQDSEDDSSEDELGIGIRRRNFGEGEDEEDDDLDGGSDDHNPGRRKRRKGEKDDQDRGFSKREIRRFRMRLQKYYDGGTSYGQSVASQMYLLVNLKGSEDNDLLWLAIIGLTYQFTSSLIDRDTYNAQVTLYQREVERINLIPQDSGLSKTCQIKLLGPDDRNIRLSEELRFTLFRHWNLYDSMFHSGYVAGKLKLWREKGRKNLQGLFAKMGFSLLQCQQNYTHMDMDLKRSLREKVEAIAPEYGLFELSFPSFVRAYGYQSVLSASDCVECVSAILEVATGVKLDFHSLHGGSATGLVDDGNQGGTLWDRGKGVRRWTEANERVNSLGDDQTFENLDPQAQGASGPSKKSKQDVWWVQNFWMACDALSTDPAFLRCALPLSMALHKSIIRQGTSMIDKQSIKTLRSFRLAVIKDGPDLHVFNHPATLTRLGVWLVDAVRDLIGPSSSKQQEGSNGLVKGKKHRPKGYPFVIASLDDDRDCYLVVGVNGAVQYGDVRKNKFGNAFQEAAELSGARARHDRFEESVIEVRKDDLMNFVQKLHLSL